MVKRGKNQKQKHWNSMNSKLKNKDEVVDVNDMDDEIDAFHKKRDMIPLDIDDDSGDSEDGDDEQAVFNYKGIDGDDDDEEEDEDDDGEFEDDDEEEEYRDTGLAKKIKKQMEFLDKNRGVGDEFLDDAKEDKERKIWSATGKKIFYGDDDDFEAKSGEEDISDEEEKEAKRLQKERAESMTAEDFGLQMDDDEMMDKGRAKSSADKEAEGDDVAMYEEVKKDLDAMSKDEQMDAVYRSAPELAGLLAELNDAFNNLETQVNPLLAKVQKVENAKKEGKNYVEVKQLLLHAYCQAIVFYLLLKSEGQPVRDHPVIARIVEIKSLLDKMKELDQFIPDELEDALNEKRDATAAERPVAKHPAFSFDPAELNELIGGSVEKKDAPQETAASLKMQLSKFNEKKFKRQEKPVSSESIKMLQHRAALEEKLRQKTVSGFDTSKTDESKKKLRRIVAGKLETAYDFDDDVMQMEGATLDNGTLSSKLSRIIPGKKKKGVSGDDDLPERDDLGQRRWKHELRVLSRAGINSNDDGVQLENEPESFSDGGDDREDGAEVDGSDDDFYTSYKRQRDLKLKMKAEKYSGNLRDVPEADITVDGKRVISAPMEKNRGLTRNRKKQNPRVKQKEKYEKAKKRRKGQVQEMRKATGPYGGEETGINSRVTKSIKFKG
ncbi:protein THALLO [Silene latifolia]|uniref:protein THALLO n=1 Tax=Silene latifolia TaxID=37657 RepID=UPI003D773F3A